MIVSGKGRYSRYLRPVSILFDIAAITLLFSVFLNGLGLNYIHFGLYQIVCWGIISYFSGFYEVYRYSTLVEILSKLIKQGIKFLLVTVAFFPFAKQTIFSGELVALYLSVTFSAIGTFKILLFYYLKYYRMATGSNRRNVIIAGYTPEAVKLRELFQTRADYGYNFLGYFTDKKHNGTDPVKGRISEICDFATVHNIDEIYCSLSDLSNTQLKSLVSFAESNNKTIKFIPDAKEIFSKNLRVDYYESVPLLSMQKTPFDEPLAKFSKRLFDIVFSLLVILLLLSWLTPILALLIRLESKGPVFFKQSRAGLNEDHFFCYKFRSMQINSPTDQLAVKNDPRVTKIGKFIRKTSIDELPQFLNVLKGDMSVVGPRPHIGLINDKYSNKIKKYVVRHRVKPGITGLAQVRGARGEISTDEDMIFRIKYDVFYIENWSLLLDIKIIIQTVVNIFTGDEQAY